MKDHEPMTDEALFRPIQRTTRAFWLFAALMVGIWGWGMYAWTRQGGGLARYTDFKSVWKTGWQDLYNRYVGRGGEPLCWENGRWRYLQMIRTKDGRGAVEFCMSLDAMLHHTRRLWRYALAHGYHSPV